MTPDAATIRARAAEHQRELEARQCLTVQDLAARWRVAPSTVRDIPADELPYLPFGRGLKLRRRRYRPEDVAAYERAHLKGGTGGVRPARAGAAA